MGQVTVSEQILSLAKPALSRHSTYRTHGTSWQYQAHMSKMNAPQKDMCHNGKPVPSGTMTAATWLAWEWKLQCTCKHVQRWLTWEWKSMVTGEHVLRGEVTCEGSQWCTCKHVERWLTWEWKSKCTCKHIERWLTWEWKSTVTCEHILRGEVTCEESQLCTCKHVERWLIWEWKSTVTCEWRSAVLLVDTSRATPDWPRRLGMEHIEAAAEVKVEAGLGEVLSRQQQTLEW